jgi:hypothetical protein
MNLLQLKLNYENSNLALLMKILNSIKVLFRSWSYVISHQGFHVFLCAGKLLERRALIRLRALGFLAEHFFARVESVCTGLLVLLQVCVPTPAPKVV